MGVGGTEEDGQVPQLSWGQALIVSKEHGFSPISWEGGRGLAG